MKAPRTATVVLPAYGVEAAIGAVIRDLAVASYALRARGMELSVLLLDGGAHAEAADAVADELGLTMRSVRGPASGPGAAFIRGMAQVIDEGDVDLIVTMDSNGRHDASRIPALIDRLVDRDSDIVIGSRWAHGSGTPGLSLTRWALGRTANMAVRGVTATQGIRDATTSFRVMRTEVVKDLDPTGLPLDTYAVHTTLVTKAVAMGYRVVEAPIIYGDALAGGGGLTLADIGEFTSHLLGLRNEIGRVRRRRLAPASRSFDTDHFRATDDLECLAASKHFFDWVLEGFAPHLKGTILEVGAGTGTITRKIVERYPDVAVVALEPAENLFSDLEAYAALTSHVTAIRGTLADGTLGSARFDVAIYVNVLEHIADDATELRLAAEALRPGGTLLVFGPALEALYSGLDHKAGHYRRYSRDRLRRLVADAGLQVVSSRYFDVLGVLPYLVVYRWLHRSNISGSSMWAYDRLIVPASRLIQRVFPDPPIGKNVTLIATKIR